MMSGVGITRQEYIEGELSLLNNKNIERRIRYAHLPFLKFYPFYRQHFMASCLLRQLLSLLFTCRRNKFMASFHLCVKAGKRGSAAEHAAYIGREGKYGSDGKDIDLVATEFGNMPDWAKDNPKLFWKAADKHERANGNSFRELVVALPNELTLQQNMELVKDFVKKEVGKKPYQLAIHEPDAALGDVKQPHLHLMLSDRMPDEISRQPEQFFSRYNRNRPELGGCRKYNGGLTRSELRDDLLTCRENWATLQNSHLEKNGHDIRVDHRSNQDQGIGKLPERHLGPAVIQKLTSGERKRYRDVELKA